MRVRCANLQPASHQRILQELTTSLVGAIYCPIDPEYLSMEKSQTVVNNLNHTRLEHGHQFIMALGGNLGDPKIAFAGVIETMQEESDKFSLIAVSSIWRTMPHGPVTEQPLFFNGALLARTSLTPVELIDWMQSQETRFGRKRLVLWGPRTLDLDLLFYDDLILSLPGRLEIPHPGIEKRDFVLLPLMEICPDHINPATGYTIREAARNLGVILENQDGSWHSRTLAMSVGRLEM